MYSLMLLQERPAESPCDLREVLFCRGYPVRQRSVVVPEGGMPVIPAGGDQARVRLSEPVGVHHLSAHQLLGIFVPEYLAGRVVIVCGVHLMRDVQAVCYRDKGEDAQTALAVHAVLID